MNYIFIGYGCLMIGYATTLLIVVKRASPHDGSTPWIVCHAALLACSGLLILIATFASAAEKALVLCAGFALLADVVINRIAKRRLGVDTPNEAGKHQ